jgi:hypothetical protein
VRSPRRPLSFSMGTIGCERSVRRFLECCGLPQLSISVRVKV